MPQGRWNAKPGKEKGREADEELERRLKDSLWFRASFNYLLDILLVSNDA